LKIGSLVAAAIAIISIILTYILIVKVKDSGKSSKFSTLWTQDEETNFMFSEVIPEGMTIELLYRGSRDGFNASSFHNKCDHNGTTLTVAKSNIYQRVFGGYTQISWDTNGYWQQDDNAFLFSVTDK
jgi:hypothetical protein